MSGLVRHLSAVTNWSSLSWDPHLCYPSPCPTPPFKPRLRKQLDLACAPSEISVPIPVCCCPRLWIYYFYWIISKATLVYNILSMPLGWALDLYWSPDWTFGVILQCTLFGGVRGTGCYPDIVHLLWEDILVGKSPLCWDSPWLTAHPCLWRSPDLAGPCCCSGEV